MKKHFICIKILFFLNLLSFSNIFAQQVGNDAFLKGQYLEVGIAKSGSFGTEGIAPSGYNANVNGRLGFVADPARDGFNVGSPSYTGDFFLPGSPEEGWGLTINGADYFNGTRVSRQDIAGSIVNYSNTATDVSATWTGNINGLEITQTVSFPKNALYFIIQVKIKNTSTSTVPGIYYMRNVDPDNEERWGGGYSTRNSIIQQPPNSNCNTGLVEAVGTNFGMYLGLGTKDDRAKVTFGGFANRSASNIWNGVSLSQSGSLTADQAISIAYNIGNLAPEQETKLTYAYVLGQDELTDALDATAEAKFFAGEVDITSEDSYTNCPGNPVTLSVSNINNYTWTWSGGDLSPTSGSSVIVNPESNTVYTVVGNPISSSSTCGFGTITRSITVNVMDEIEPQVFTKPITITLDENGSASITGSDINDESNDTCGIASIVASKTSFDCSNIGANTVSLTVTDTNGNIASADAIVTVEDTSAPSIVLNGDASVTHEAFTTYTDLGATTADNCSTTLVSSNDVDENIPGSYTVTYTATDASGNETTKTRTVVVQDVTVPIAMAKDITVQLDASGNASIVAGDIDNGSSDNSGEVTLSINENTFGCENLETNSSLNFDGDNDIISLSKPLSIGQGNSTVEAWIKVPKIGSGGLQASERVGIILGNYPSSRNLGYELYNQGQIRWWWNNGQIDVRGTRDLRDDKWHHVAFVRIASENRFIAYIDGEIEFNIVKSSSSFNMTAAPKIGGDNRSNPPNFHGNIDELSVWNVAKTQTEIQSDLKNRLNGNEPNLSNYWNFNEASGTSLQDIASNNDNNGTLVSMDASSDWVNGVSNIVVLKATDPSGNSSTTTARIIVEDTIAPETKVNDITVQLDANGNASITAAQLDNGSNDACGIASIVASKTSFDCSNIGANTVSLTVTDINGNVASADAIVTVEDATAPVAIAQDITVQLDANGVASILPSDIDNGSNDACGVTLALSKVEFDCSNVGANTVTLTVTDANENVSTIDAIVTVEDATAPTAIAQDITVQLDANGVASILPSDIDNGSNDACGITLTLSKLDFDCSNVGANTVTLSVTDANANVSTIDAVVTVEDTIAPVAIAQDITLQLDANGVASILPSDIDNGSNDACGVTLALSKVDFDCSNVGANTVTLTVTDANENVSTIDAIVTVEDATAPVAIAQDITVQLDANGVASILPSDIDNGSNDACGVTLALSKVEFDCSNVGANTVTLTVTDANENVSTIDAIVTVEDATAPTAIAQDITVQLDANGVASILPSDIDNGSNDACGITLTLSKLDFDCSNVGANTVTLTVTDANANVSTIDAVVTVEDTIAPVAIAQDLTLVLDANGNASITAAQLDNGSNDACGIASIVASKTSFDCSNAGLNTVSLTVTDINGNVASVDATVTVEDTIDPVAIAQNISIDLDATGNATITPEMIDNGSSDNCSFTTSLDMVNFTCANIGIENTVTLTVTDASGNSASTTATVTVNDVTLPTVLTQPITVSLDENGEGTTTAEAINNGSNDACGIASIAIDIASFDCSNLGENTVTLTVTDNNGNIASEQAIVTVVDTIAPIVGTRNISVELDANGAATITPEDVLLLTEDDVERGDQCTVSAAKYHAMYLSNYGYANNYYKADAKEENDAILKNEDIVEYDDNQARHHRRNARFIFDENQGSLIKNLDGTATVTGTLVNTMNSDDKWIVTLNLENARNWTEWSALGRRYKGNRWRTRSKYKDWMYYEMATGSKITGAGINEGKETMIYHAPSNKRYGFQVGDGANLQNANLGLSGWFYYKNRRGRWAQGDFNLNITDCDKLPIPDGTILTSDNCSIESYALDVDTFGCDDLGENIVQVSVTDQSGNTTTKPVTITVLGDKPEVRIQDFTLAYGQKKNTIFLGYEESVHLCPVVTGGDGFTYQWTDESGTVVSTKKLPKVSPKFTTTYTLTVTNSNGCATSASIEVCVIDARANNNQYRYNERHGYHGYYDKVKICIPQRKNGTITYKEINVKKSYVKYYLKRGATLGGCNATCVNEDDIVIEPVVELSLYPNPSSGIFNVEVKNLQKDATVLLYNMYGRVIQRKYIRVRYGQNKVQMGYHRLREGAYIVKVLTDGNIFTKTMLIQRTRH